MEEREFNALADAMLARIEQALEACEADIDFELKDGGADGSGKAGHFAGYLGKSAGAPYPWVSLSVGFNPGASPTDISAVKAIRFMVKGDGKRYRIALPRTAVTDYANFRTEFDTSKEWKQVEIPLSKLAQPSWGKQVEVSWADVHGSTDASGMAPATEPVTPDDVSSTIFHNLGIAHSTELQTPTGRPMQLFREGKVIEKLLG